jgi:hypothetical protein
MNTVNNRNYRLMLSDRAGREEGDVCLSKQQVPTVDFHYCKISFGNSLPRPIGSLGHLFL